MRTEKQLGREAPEGLAAGIDALLGRGDALQAVLEAEAARAQWPREQRLEQLYALALARAGATGRAREVLLELVRRGAQDVETLGILARTAKDLGDAAASPGERDVWHAQALAEYRAAHDANPSAPWPGINAAVLALTLGRSQEARALAAEVRRRCEARRAAGAYWTLATLGEAALVLGDAEDAVRWYREAVAVPGAGPGERASTLKNARRVFALVPGARERIEEVLRVPTVLVYVGHMLDRPGRARERFPPSAGARVRGQIVAELERHSEAVTFGSAASGFDLLLLEEAQRRGFHTHVVLPYAPQAFRADCVAYAGEAEWGGRFDRLLAASSSVRVVSPARLSGGWASIEYANTVVLGLARAHARQLESRVEGLALWDGQPGDGPGGTAWNVGRWREAGLPTRVITLSTAAAPADSVGLQPPATSVAAEPVAGASAEPAFTTTVKAVLFADVKGYSLLGEAQVPLFVRAVLGAVGRLCDEPGWGLVARNTWGDGLYLVFEGVREAGLFALALLQRVQAAARAEPGLPAELGLRVALHAGAVYAFTDPVTRLRSYGGTHVTWAARLEPVTPPGQVYATQWYAALVEALGVREIQCDYVGEVDLAKRAGRHPAYVVRAASAWRT